MSKQATRRRRRGTIDRAAKASVEALEGRVLLAVDFSIATVSDTQYTVETFPQLFKGQTQWIADHASDPAYKIGFFSHQGDMLRRGYSDYQASNADAALKTLDNVVPYSVSIGNHDYDNQFDDVSRHVSSANFTSWFGNARYQAIANSGFGGSSLDQRNRYQIVTMGGRQFLSLSIEWEAPDATLAWAQGVINANPTTPVILSTHEYLNSAGRTTSALDPAGNSGEGIYQKFVKLNPQIFLVLSGHTGAVRAQSSLNNAGSRVYEIAADFEGRSNGGDGWMQLLQFDLAGGTIALKNVRPGTGGGADQFETGTTFAGINFAQRWSLSGTPVVVDNSWNTAPTATPDIAATPEGKAVSINVAANDADADAGQTIRPILFGTLVDDPDVNRVPRQRSTGMASHGAVFANADGTFTYTPDPKFVGTDTFTYVASDGLAVSVPVTVPVNVRPSAPNYAYPIAESTTVGTRTGTFNNLRASDGVVESVAERISSGTDVDQRWQFNVTAGTDVTLAVNAWRSFSNPGTGDEYHPQYSTNGGATWIDPVLLAPAASHDVTRVRFDANEPYQMWALPAGTSGTVWVRMTDVNTSGTETVDTLTVDEIFIRSGVAFPTVSIAATNGGETGPSPKFTVTRTGSTAADLAVNYTLGGTATAGDDYATPTGTVTIPAGATSATFSLLAINDGLVEGDETIVATLGAADGYDLTGTGAATAVLADADTTPPVPATALTVTGKTATTIALAWTAAADNVAVTAYDVYRVAAGGDVLVGSTAGTSYTAGGLSGSTTYQFYVTARDAAGNVSPASNVASATTPAALQPPTAPSNLTLTALSSRRVRLNWSDASNNETGFKVWSSRDGVNWSPISTLGAGSTTYTTGTLAKGTWYFRVSSYNAAGESNSAIRSILL